MKQRLDLLMVERGLAESRTLAQRLIGAGQVYTGDRRLDKAGVSVDAHIPLEVRTGLPFVSRGGQKLAAAWESFHLEVGGKVCVDIGASTGGFTDCLLQRGASRVYAVDVGYGQLHWKLRQDPRVTVMEEGLDDAETYLIVGQAEADPLAGRISNESPLGRALLGRPVGDQVLVSTPSGVIRFDILDSGSRLDRQDAVTAAEAELLAHRPEAIAERVYGLGNQRKSRELGNTQPDDGFRFRGNGVLQTTGRGNHQRMGAACGIDFEINPDLVIAPEHALKPALHEWTANNLNVYADKNDIRTITRRINGGLIGLAEREAWLNKVWPLLKEDDQPAAPWEASDEDDDVKWLQQALNDLGADPKLVVDGRYGPATRRAVRAFQKVAGLVADGVAGPVTEAAINLRLGTIRGG